MNEAALEEVFASLPAAQRSDARQLVGTTVRSPEDVELKRRWVELLRWDYHKKVSVGSTPKPHRKPWSKGGAT